MAKIGVWIIGASGSVSCISMAGAAAISKKLIPTTGLVTDLPEFRSAGFCRFSDIVFGGHEIRKPQLKNELEQFISGGVGIPPAIMAAARSQFPSIEKRIKRGTAIGCGSVVERLAGSSVIKAGTSAQVVEKIKADITQFVRREKVNQLIVVNLASTEPPFKPMSCHNSLIALRKAMQKRGASPLPASSLYAMAALELGAAYINFTPSLGANVPALLELADSTGGLVTGADGKTGETLCKSVIAPLFAMRNLKILSWVGHNIFGNRDALVLDDPVNKASKVKSKDHLIQSIVGYSPKTLVTIENIPDMGDWKTAWDHIHFEGFLGTKMIMQFIWQGCDSLLAAPLVLDLIRLAALAQSRGERGLMKQTACFFKSPMGVEEQDMSKQFQMLCKYLKG